MDQNIKAANVKNKLISGTIVGLTLFLSILRIISVFGMRGFNCEGLPFDLDVICTPGNILYELSLWLVVVLLVGYQLFRSKEIRPFITAWRNNWILVAFISFVFLSAIWTAALSVTLTKAVILLICTITFAYLGSHYKVETVFRFLVRFFSILTVINLIFVFVIPNLGTSSDPLYIGSWRGIFWHKNYLGSITAFGSSLFLMDLLAYPHRRLLMKICEGFLLLLSIWLIIMSHSAAGLIILIILMGICLVIYLWLKIKIHLRPLHYIILGFIALIGVAFILFNLDFIFGLLNRNTSLTGRLPLWQYLINNIIISKPWLGNGYGAIWAFEGFREHTSAIVNWRFPIFIGDNGLIDITLHLGIAGLILTLAIYVISLIRSVQYIQNGKNLICFFPLVGSIFGFLANISLSMFLELEYMVWLLIVFPLFIHTSQFTNSQAVSAHTTK